MGESHGMHVFTEAQVIRMRELHSQGYTATKLAQMFGGTMGNMCQIVNGLSWRHLLKDGGTMRRKHKVHTQREASDVIDRTLKEKGR